MTGRKMCQPERKLSWTRRRWMPVVLFLAVILMWTGSTASSKQSCRILSANVFTWRPEVVFLRDIDADALSKSGTHRTSLRSGEHNKSDCVVVLLVMVYISWSKCVAW